MFVVAMTIAVLASVGIYALAAAANEVRTSGNERQNTQTHYLAELRRRWARRTRSSRPGAVLHGAHDSPTTRTRCPGSLPGRADDTRSSVDPRLPAHGLAGARPRAGLARRSPTPTPAPSLTRRVRPRAASAPRR